SAVSKDACLVIQPYCQDPGSVWQPWTEVARSGHCAEISGDLDHPVREAPLVVVPREHPDEALVEHLGLGHVEGRAVRIVVEIDGHGRRLVDADDTLQPVR